MTPEKGARTPKGAEPAPGEPQNTPLRLVRGRERPASRLLLVSAGLAEGGGIAAAGRLLLGAVQQWASRRGSSLRVLTLGGPEDLPPGVDGEAFAGDRARLALAVWRAQLAGYRTHVYDFLGMARIQGMLPAPLRARYLLYLYGIECWKPLRGTRRAAVTGASARLACSTHTASELRRHNAGLPEVEVLHLALAEAPPAAGAGAGADAALLAELGEGFLLIVGRMEPGERYKGHDELLAALPRLAEAHPAVRLVVAGDGPDRARLEGLAAALGVAGRVRFTGFVSSATLAELYARCAVFAMPSQGEGFGFVFLEAMRAGKPCVALRGGAPAEIVVDGETGVLVERGVEALAEGLGALLAQPARAVTLGAAGRARWQSEFAPARFAAGLARHLDALAGAGTP